MIDYSKLKPLKSVGSIIKFRISGFDDELGEHVSRVKFDGFINNGYIASIRVVNYNFSLMDKLLGNSDDKQSLLRRLRNEPIEAQFSIEQRNPPEPGVTPEQHSTGVIIGNLAMIHFSGERQGEGVEFIIADKLTWGLRIGDSFGGFYIGNPREIASTIINKYIPSVNLDAFPQDGMISKTKMKFFTFREPPYRQLIRLLNISQTNGHSYKIGINGNQASIRSLAYGEMGVSGYYEHLDEQTSSDVITWKNYLNNSISHDKMAVTTSGISSSTGKIYTAPIDGENLNKNVGNKHGMIEDRDIYKVKQGRIEKITSTFKPIVSEENKTMWKTESYGTTFVESLPEYDIDVPYSEYMGANARTDYISNMRKLFNMKLTVIGHGVWNNTDILGLTAVYVDWRSRMYPNLPKYIMSGYWIVYGFSHNWHRNKWTTTLDMFRYDENAVGVLELRL